MTSASDDKSCVSKFNQVENEIQNYINSQLIILQDSAYDAGYEAGKAAAPPVAAVVGAAWEVYFKLVGENMPQALTDYVDDYMAGDVSKLGDALEKFKLGN